MRTKEELIKLRRNFLAIDEAEKVQKELIAIYTKEYKPKHSKAFYYQLIIDNEVGEIKERHAQDNQNWSDKVFQVFSCVSQHVRGFTKEHCLDLVYDAVVRRKQRLALYKTLPTIDELVNSKKKIVFGKEYETKGSTDIVTYSGETVLEMRKVGIDKYRSDNTPQWRKDAELRFVLGRPTVEKGEAEKYGLQFSTLTFKDGRAAVSKEQAKILKKAIFCKK